MFILINSQVRAQRRGVVLWPRWVRWVVKVHYIWDDRNINPTPLAHFGRRQGIDHHMMNARQSWRKCHLKIVADAVDQKPFPFPEKIVVMSNDWNARFSDQFGQGKTERNIHRNRESIFGDQQL